MTRPTLEGEKAHHVAKSKADPTATFDPGATAIEEMARAEDRQSSRLGLRSIALFEAAKGVLVIVLGLGLSSYLHHDAARVLTLIDHIERFNPAHHVPAVFINAINSVSNMNLWLLAAGALAYALVRFIEAYGLWHQKVWAEWFAIASGGVYLPFELYELISRFSRIKVLVVLVNLAVVGYLAWQRVRQERAQTRAEKLDLKAHAARPEAEAP